MKDWISINKDEKHIAKEKQKARDLRKSVWWENRINEGICYYCKRKFKPDGLTMDHIVPLARGGRSAKGNVVSCCKECNSEKKYYTPVEMVMKKLESEKTKEEKE